MISSAMQIGYGIKDTIEAKKLKKELEAAGGRPQYEAPAAARESLNNARMLASMTRLPGQDQMEANLGQNSAQAISNVKDYAGGGVGAMAAVAGINQNQNQATADLGIQAANFRATNQKALQGSLNEFSGYQDKAFELNKFNPYLEKAAAIRALYASGRQNTVGGVKAIEDKAMDVAKLVASPV
jgi:hypothetical protein